MDAYETAALIEALQNIGDKLETVGYTLESLTASIDTLTETYTNTQTKDNNN